MTGYAIIFENKVKGAGDQPNQLARYIDKTLKQGFKKDKIFVIYLPHDEHEPEEYSWILDGKNYIQQLIIFNGIINQTII